jgi:hypothetical protein
LPAYIVCPLCGRNRVVESKKGPIRWDYVDLHNAPILQIREGGGKKAGPPVKGKGKAPGSGFHLVESRTLSEILENPKYREIIEGLKSQLARLVRDGIRLGLLTKDDI